MPRKFSFLLLILFSIWSLSCTTDSDSDSIDFGAEYEIVVSDEYPSLSSSELSVEVSYSGCDSNHDFALDFRSLVNQQHEAWLIKLTPDQECEAFFQEVKRFPLPAELQSGGLILEAPNTRLVLREE